MSRIRAPKTPKGVYTAPELAGYMGLQQGTIYRLAKQGKIPAFKIGVEWRFDKAIIKEWIENQHKERQNYAVSK